MDLLNYYCLQPATQKFILVPYCTGMSVNPQLTGIRSRQSHKLSWLCTVFEKYGVKWPDILVKEGHFRISGIEDGVALFSAVMPVSRLIALIQKTEQIKHRSSERLLDDLSKIGTEQVLILIPTGRLDYTELDYMSMSAEFSKHISSLTENLPKDEFVPYSREYMKRGSVLQLEDGRRAIAINGFHLADEPVEPASPLQVLAIDGCSLDAIGDNLLWVLSDSGMLADKSKVLIHPGFVCDSSTVDKLFLYCKCFVIVDTNRASEKAFDLDNAFALAARLYKGIEDFAGEPYLLHVFKVIERAKTTSERICAMLHDVLTVRPDISVNNLFDEGVPLSILQALVALTQNQDEDYYDYIRRVRMNPLATKIKKSCLIHDMDLTRINGKPKEEDFERKYKFQKAYTLLSTKND